MHLPAPSSDPRIQFWSNSQDWPQDDLPGFVFLARAVGVVGEAIFGTGWTGMEPAVELVAPLPEELSASIASVELLRGCRLLHDGDETYRGRCPDFVQYIGNWPIPNEVEWQRAVSIAQSISQERRLEFGRFLEVCDRMARRFNSGRIQTATRQVDGGLMNFQDRWFWNTENYWGRFQTCRVDLRMPFNATSITAGGEYLFVHIPSFAASLEPAAEANTSPATTEADVEQYLSPYLRCMIAATRGLAINANDKRKKQDIVVELPKFWPGSSEPPSKEDYERMATLMREPEHKGGQRFKRK